MEPPTLQRSGTRLAAVFIFLLSNTLLATDQIVTGNFEVQGTTDLAGSLLARTSIIISGADQYSEEGEIHLDNGAISFSDGLDFATFYTLSGISHYGTFYAFPSGIGSPSGTIATREWVSGRIDESLLSTSRVSSNAGPLTLSASGNSNIFLDPGAAGGVSIIADSQSTGASALEIYRRNESTPKFIIDNYGMLRWITPGENSYIAGNGGSLTGYATKNIGFNTSSNINLIAQGKILMTRAWVSPSATLSSGYSWLNASLTTDSIEIVNSNSTISNKAPTLGFHRYGTGGPQFRLDPTGTNVLYLESANENSARLPNPYGGGTNNYFNRFHIDGALSTSGNVGLGTPTPTERLDVNGNALVQNNLTVKGKIRIPASGDLSMGQFQENGGLGAPDQ